MLDIEGIRSVHGSAGSNSSREALGLAIRTAINEYIRSNGIKGKTTPKKTVIHTPNLVINLPGLNSSQVRVTHFTKGNGGFLDSYRNLVWSTTLNRIKTIQIDNGLLIFNGVAAFKY